jgi:uncharacterized protein YraI
MRSMIVAAAALLVALTSPVQATAFCEVRQTSDGFVAMRAGPAASARLVRRLKAGEQVQIDRSVAMRGQWVRVLYTGRDKAAMQPGWVNSRLISDQCG